MAVVVYGVMRARECPSELGVEGRRGRVAVRGVEHDGLAALVSDAPGGSLRVHRDALLVHSEVLHLAMEHGPVLPLRFGVVLQDEESVHDELLAPNAHTFEGRLEALEGTAEFQVKVTFDSEHALQSILATDGSLADRALRVRALPGAAGHFDRVRLGEAIAQRIAERAAAAEEEVVAAIDPFVLGLERGPRHHEWMAANLACLVQLDGRAEFDAAIDRLAAEHAGELHVKLIGPLAPHSFAERDWEATWG